MSPRFPRAALDQRLIKGLIVVIGAGLTGLFLLERSVNGTMTEASPSRKVSFAIGLAPAFS